jgi:acetyl/propionyl-CoA carboxylase alpha subunit
MIQRVLVANRGEIARRVFATCRRLGIGTVAVYTEPDAASPHVSEADARVRLDGRNGYLDAAQLIDAARASGADAIHPGYGFLSENAEFAAAVQKAGLTWIGPPVPAVQAMGSKIEAKKMMAAAGVPVLDELDPDTVTAEQLPVLIKASAGGGACGWSANWPNYQGKWRPRNARPSPRSATQRCSASATSRPGITSRSR